LDSAVGGTSVPRPALTGPLVAVALSRGSTYAAQRGGRTVSGARFPAAVAGAWAGQDSDVAIAVASIVDQPTSVSFDFDPRAYGLRGGGQIERIDETGRRPLGTFSGRVAPIRLELPAGGAYVLEFRPSRRGCATAFV